MSRYGYVALALIAFAITLVVYAPASIVARAFERVPDAALTETNGSLWSGSGALQYRGEPLGRLTWRFRPAPLLELRAAYDTRLEAPSHRLAALVSAAFGAIAVDLGGRLDAAALAPLLAPYDITMGGTFEIDRVIARSAWDARQMPHVSGTLRWSGGPVTYRLSGRTHRVTLPPLLGLIESAESGPVMTVRQSDNETPLMIARLDAEGWASIGITKRFTQILGQPWPGSDADHIVVLEVQEKLL